MRHLDEVGVSLREGDSAIEVPPRRGIATIQDGELEHSLPRERVRRKGRERRMSEEDEGERGGVQEPHR